MNRTESQEFVTTRYPYGVLERALGEVFRASEKVQRSTLRGRLKRLATLGLPGVGRGKGQRILYSREQSAQLLVALLMAELGIDPTVIVRLVKEHWKTITVWVHRATDDEAKGNPNDEVEGNPIYFTLRPRLMSGPWADPKHPLETVTWIG